MIKKKSTCLFYDLFYQGDKLAVSRLEGQLTFQIEIRGGECVLRFCLYQIFVFIDCL